MLNVGLQKTDALLISLKQQESYPEGTPRELMLEQRSMFIIRAEISVKMD